MALSDKEWVNTFTTGCKLWRPNQITAKDTVTTDEEDDEVNAHHHVGEDWPSICHDAIIHHSVPVLSSEDLQQNNNK